MTDEVPVSLRLPKDLHARIKELAPARGASAWMVRALAYMAVHHELLDQGITDTTKPTTSSKRLGGRPLEREEVTTYWKHRTR